jgi:hypothetical protein
MAWNPERPIARDFLGAKSITFQVKGEPVGDFRREFQAHPQKRVRLQTDSFLRISS